MRKSGLVLAMLSGWAASTEVLDKSLHLHLLSVRCSAALLDQAWAGTKISRLGMNSTYDDPHILLNTSDHHRVLNEAVSSKRPEHDSPVQLLRIGIPFHLASAVDLVSCAGHRHRRPPFHCSYTENMAVELKSKQSAIVHRNASSDAIPKWVPRQHEISG